MRRLKSSFGRVGYVPALHRAPGACRRARGGSKVSLLLCCSPTVLRRSSGTSPLVAEVYHHASHAICAEKIAEMARGAAGRAPMHHMASPTSGAARSNGMRLAWFPDASFARATACSRMLMHAHACTRIRAHPRARARERACACALVGTRARAHAYASAGGHRVRMTHADARAGEHAITHPHTFAHIPMHTPIRAVSAPRCIFDISDTSWSTVSQLGAT